MISEKANLHHNPLCLVSQFWLNQELLKASRDRRGKKTALKHAIFVQGAFFLTLNDFPSIDYAHVLGRRSRGGYKRSHMLQPWALVLESTAVSSYVMLPRICHDCLVSVWKSVLVLARLVLTGLTHEFNHIWSTVASCCWLCASTLMKIMSLQNQLKHFVGYILQQKKKLTCSWNCNIIFTTIKQLLTITVMHEYIFSFL